LAQVHKLMLLAPLKQLFGFYCVNRRQRCSAPDVRGVLLYGVAKLTCDP
jgi:hypothetical protein